MSALPPKADLVSTMVTSALCQKQTFCAAAELALFDQSARARSVGGINGECRPNGRSHVHLIPRRHGDVADARGVIRGIITGKAAY